MNISEHIERLIRLGMSEKDACYFVHNLLMQGIAMSAIREGRDKDRADNVVPWKAAE